MCVGGEWGEGSSRSSAHNTASLLGRLVLQVHSEGALSLHPTPVFCSLAPPELARAWLANTCDVAV